MIKKSLINTKDFIKMIKRATISNEIELLEKTKINNGHVIFMWKS